MCDNFCLCTQCYNVKQTDPTGKKMLELYVNVVA